MSIEKKRIEAEYIRVYASRVEMELRVAEFEEKIVRLKNSIRIQMEAEEKLKQKIENLEVTNG